MACHQLFHGTPGPSFLTAQAAQPRPAIAALVDRLAELGSGVDTLAHERAGAVAPAVMAALFEAKLFALTAPTAYGGLGASMLEFVHCVRELGRHDAALVVTAVPHLGNGIKSVALYGSEAQKQEVLGGITRNQRLVSFAITEAHTGSDIASHRSRLDPQDEGYRLSGAKTWITNIPYAGHVVVAAKCPHLCKNPEGSAWVLVKPDDRGFAVSRRWHKLGIAAAPTVDLYLDDIDLPSERLVGTLGAGMLQFPQIVGSGRMGAAAGACGLAEHALQLLRDHPGAGPRDFALYERLAPRLAAMAATLETTAVCHDQACPDQELDTTLCKAFCTNTALTLITQVYRHWLTHRGPVPPLLAQLMREIPAFRIFEGPNEVLSYRAALTLLTMLRRTPTPSATTLGTARQQARLNHLLTSFHQWLHVQAAQPDPLQRHEPLQHIAALATTLYAATCTLAKETSHPDPTLALAADLQLTEAEHHLDRELAHTEHADLVAGNA